MGRSYLEHSVLYASNVVDNHFIRSLRGIRYIVYCVFYCYGTMFERSIMRRMTAVEA